MVVEKTQLDGLTSSWLLLNFKVLPMGDNTAQQLVFEYLDGRR
jgi:hypothetical protein